VCEAQSGYILNDEVHLGKRTKMRFDSDDEPEPPYEGGVIGRITIYVIRHYLKKGHVLACDNRFTSADLFEHLFVHHGTTAVGTLRSLLEDVPT
jgi:Transposase IS4